MPLSYADWKRKLIQSSGTVSTSVILLGDRVLELFWRDGCEPSISGLLDYAQSGLHPVHQARSARVRSTSVMNQL
jgi:hypothetical protein